ncbi:MAG TPA: histidine kinase [Chryseolinea sp.]|nr:histidine kinase [Chryseolinea sp.]
MTRLSSAYLDMNSSLRRIGTIILISGSGGALLYTYLHFSETGSIPSVVNFSGFVASAIIGAFCGIGLYFVNNALDKWIPWRNFFASRFVLGLVIDYLIAVALCFTLSSITLAIFSSPVFWLTFSAQDEDLKIKALILIMTAIFIYNIIYALLYSYQQYAVAQLENLQRERRQLELQFEALKNQLSPHYLFNSLNTISSLIYKDTQSAEQFIRRLAQTYQYILSSQQKRFVTLKDEVDFVQSYYYLLRIRFQQQLSVEINLPSNIMNSRIPPLTLQILVENAVKHNTITSDRKLFIYITAQDNTYLKVINTKNEPSSNVQSFRVGLENIKKRYEFFTDKKIEIRDDEKFSVSLPVLHQKEWDLAIEHKHIA